MVKQPHSVKTWSSLAALFVAYLLAAELGHALTFADWSFASIWPPSGVFVAFLIRSHKSRWMSVISVATLANLTSDVFVHDQSALLSLVFCLSNTIEAVFGALLIRSRHTIDFSLDSVRSVLDFLLFPTLLSTGVMAIFGSFIAVKLVGAYSYFDSFVYWWMGGSMGVMIMAPLTLLLMTYASGQWRPHLTVTNVGSFALLNGLFAAIATAVFVNDTELTFIPFACLVGIAMVFGSRGVVLGGFILSVTSAWCVARQIGPFAEGSYLQMTAISQMYIGASSFTALIVGALIAQRHASEEKLRISENRFRDLAVRSPVGILQTNALGVVTFINQHCCEILRHECSDLEGRHWVDLVHHEDRYRAYSLWMRAMSNSRSTDAEFRLESESDSDPVWVKGNFGSVVDPISGEVVCIGSLTDITDSVKKEQQLIATEAKARAYADELLVAKDHAEAANAAKDRFLAMVSHELRTPLSGVIGISELVLDTQLDMKQKQYVEMMHRSAEYLLHIINDILDLTKIESGRLELHNEDVDIRALISDVYKFFEMKSTEKGIKLIYDVDLPYDRAVCDSVRLRQVLMNLVGNAFKFTERGYVKIHARVISDHLILSVEDTGIGIAKCNWHKVFEPFLQASSGTTRKYGGSGLGLAITKRLVTLMRGSIDFDSSENLGSVFRLSLPMKFVHAESPEKQPGKEKDTQMQGAQSVQGNGIKKNGRILLAEDNEVNQVLAKAILEQYGCKVEIAKNGNEAVSMFLDKPFDLILMDIEMPDLDGVGATRVIRQTEKDADHHTPIVAMTAHVLPQYEQMCLQSGMDSYLSKPIDRSKLAAVLGKYLPQSFC